MGMAYCFSLSNLHSLVEREYLVTENDDNGSTAIAISIILFVSAQSATICGIGSPSVTLWLES